MAKKQAPQNDHDIDYRAEGADKGKGKKSRTDEGYDEAVSSGPSRYGVPEGHGGVFGTSGGGTYGGGMHVEEHPGVYDRSGAPGAFEPGDERQSTTGRDSDRIEHIDTGKGRKGT